MRKSVSFCRGGAREGVTKKEKDLTGGPIYESPWGRASEKTRIVKKGGLEKS